MSTSGAQTEAAGPVVWVVSGDHWPRACLRAELIERGYHALGFETVADARSALGEPDVPRPEAALVDLAGQAHDPKGIATLADLVRSIGPVVAVAGSIDAHSPELRALPWASFLARPVSLGTLADAVSALRPLHH
jgi:hypothetical protein